jgi:uncharacterized protein YdeI (YjbR/CyaY-like superfamily)
MNITKTSSTETALRSLWSDRTLSDVIREIRIARRRRTTETNPGDDASGSRPYLTTDFALALTEHGMGTRDKRVDAYIAKARDSAKPILAWLRDVVHEACPDVQENIKWGAPFFEYHGVMCMMAVFKNHCKFGFWNSKLVYDQASRDAGTPAMLDHIESLKGLPSKKVITGFIKKAMKLNEEGVKSPTRTKRAPKPEIAMPKEFRGALAKNKKAKGAYDAFAPSHQREYLQWITEAKTDATRDRRIEQAVEWIAEGKQRNWKYQR